MYRLTLLYTLLPAILVPSRPQLPTPPTCQARRAVPAAAAGLGISNVQPLLLLEELCNFWCRCCSWQASSLELPLKFDTAATDCAAFTSSATMSHD